MTVIKRTNHILFFGLFNLVEPGGFAGVALIAFVTANTVAVEEVPVQLQQPLLLQRVPVVVVKVLPLECPVKSKKGWVNQIFF